MNNMLFKVLSPSSDADCRSTNVPYARADRPSAVYKTGEEIIFHVRGSVPGASYTVHDGVRESAPLPLTQEIRYKTENPGFILITIAYPEEMGNTVGYTYAGAAVDPEKIKAGTGMPEDFDSFWDEELKILHSHPPVIRETAVDRSLVPDGVKAFDITITRGDVTATGYVAFPSDAGKKSLPACLTFLGASKVTAELPIPAVMAKEQGILAFNLNFHGLPNFWPQNDKNVQDAVAKINHYQFKSAEDRKEYAMRKIFLRTVLAAEYVMQHPQFNGGKLAAVGGSLGGCQAIVCSALTPQVTFCVSQATAMCDHNGEKAGHLPGWPFLLKTVPTAVSNAPYFDIVNFMHRVKCPVYMAVGFVDITCPPASTYAAFNTLKSKEKVMGHTVTGAHGGHIDEKDPDVFTFWYDKVASHLKSF